MPDPAPLWQPTSISLPSEPVFTDTKPVAVETDIGGAYLKPLWQDGSKHWLIREMIGLRLAAALGLDAPRCAVYDVIGYEAPEDRHGNVAQEGPGLIIERIDWAFWDGTPASLQKASNRADVAGLVMLDTWLRNTDRFPPTAQDGQTPDLRLGNLQNVALSPDPDKKNRLRLRAVDFSRTLHPDRPLEAHRLDANAIEDRGVYGLFPGFRGLIKRKHIEEFAARLDALPSESIRALVAAVPLAWWPDGVVKAATEAFLLQRREMVRSNIGTLLGTILGWLDV